MTVRFQNMMMFCGELFCLFYYLATRPRAQNANRQGRDVALLDARRGANGRIFRCDY